MTSYLLDTNIVSDLVRNPHGLAAARVARAGHEHICTSIVVAAELRYGVARGVSRVVAERVKALLERLTILPLTAPADEYYADLRASLEAKGKPIGTNDLLIAAHALALDSTLVTDNVREFSRISGLRVENWLR